MPFQKGHPYGRRFKKGQISWNKNKTKKDFPQMSNSGVKKGQFTGKNACHWKGGKIYKKGYIYLFKPKHPFCNCDGYVRRSHLVMEKKIGRFLKPQEIVHHINGIRDDDRIENLKLFKNHSEHMKHHRQNLSPP